MTKERRYDRLSGSEHQPCGGPAPALPRVRIPLDDMKVIRRAFGGTVNDVVLCGVAGGLRRLLESQYAAPTSLGLAARAAHRQPFFNVVCTNVPGPQVPLRAHADARFLGAEARPDCCEEEQPW